MTTVGKIRPLAAALAADLRCLPMCGALILRLYEARRPVHFDRLLQELGVGSYRALWVHAAKARAAFSNGGCVRSGPRGSSTYELTPAARQEVAASLARLGAVATRLALKYEGP
jgi:hypothetical protein